MDATSSEVELKRLLAELRRRPHLLRDPHIARLVAAAVDRLQTSPLPVAEEVPLPVERAPVRKGQFGVVLHCAGDIVAIAVLLSAPWYLPERLAFASPFVAGCVLAFVWLFIRSEALRVMAIETAALVWRMICSALLWYAEALFAPARRAWRKACRVEDLVAAWRQRPATERRSFASLLAFIDAELSLSLTELGSLGEPPDRTQVNGRLGKLGNPVLRWRGDKRLLPSSLRWIIARAVRLAETASQTTASQTETAVATSSTHTAPDQAAVTEKTTAKLMPPEEADRIRARIKSLEEEIQKIQKWNVSKEAEEMSRRNLIKEKRLEMNELKKVLHSIELRK